MEPLTPPAAHTSGAYQVQNSSSDQDSHPASKLPLQWALSDEEQQFCTDVLGGGLISSNDLEMIWYAQVFRYIHELDHGFAVVLLVWVLGAPLARMVFSL